MSISQKHIYFRQWSGKRIFAATCQRNETMNCWSLPCQRSTKGQISYIRIDAEFPVSTVLTLIWLARDLHTSFFKPLECGNIKVCLEYVTFAGKLKCTYTHIYIYMYTHRNTDTQTYTNIHTDGFNIKLYTTLK